VLGNKHKKQRKIGRKGEGREGGREGRREGRKDIAYNASTYNIHL
jgi:hypothetical protein